MNKKSLHGLINSSHSSNCPGAKNSGKELNKFCPPNSSDDLWLLVWDGGTWDHFARREEVPDQRVRGRKQPVSQAPEVNTTSSSLNKQKIKKNTAKILENYLLSIKDIRPTFLVCYYTIRFKQILMNAMSSRWKVYHKEKISVLMFQVKDSWSGVLFFQWNTVFFSLNLLFPLGHKVLV